MRARRISLSAEFWTHPVIRLRIQRRVKAVLERVMNSFVPLRSVLLIGVLSCFAAAQGTSAPKNQQKQTPQNQPSGSNAAPALKPNVPASNAPTDRAQAYYHYSLAHIYEELAAMSGRSEYA